VANTGRIITSAALILIVVTGAFAFSEIVMMKYIAFGMIAALIIDATVIRMLLVPAVMQMLGTDNWWAPGWMKRVQERIGLGEAEIDDEPDLLTGRSATTGTAEQAPAADTGVHAESAGAGQPGVAAPTTGVGVLDREPGTEPEFEPETEPEPEWQSESELEPEAEFEPVRDPEYDEEPDITEDGKIPASDLIARLMRERQQGRDA